MEAKVLISPLELDYEKTCRDVVILDTRSPETYASGHIAGSVNIRDIFTYLATSDEAGVNALRGKFASLFGSAGLSGREHAVIYEESMNSGFGQSCRGYLLLKYLGYPRVSILLGGFLAWQAAQLPVTNEVSTPAPKTFPLAAHSTDVIIGREDMLRAIGLPQIVKLDVRDVDEWIGRSSSPYGVDYAPRKGRIPGAVWIEWYRMMKPGPLGQMFKSPEEILAECHSAGFGPKSTVYVYCFKGARAANTYVALKSAGFTDVRVYLASWNEWSRDPSLPIETGLPYEQPAA
jgi:thiosulfate/3-mercaptopyruvate sulfurtransferase